MGLLVPAPIAKDEAERIVQDKLRWILGSSDPMAVIVFGSAARDEMTERSDIDLALIYPDEASLKAGRRAIHGQNPAGSWPADLLFYAPFDKTASAAVALSLACNILLLLAKSAAFFWSGSEAVLASTVDSVIDLVSQGVLAAAERASASRDARFPVGRARMSAVGVASAAGIMLGATLLVVQASASDLYFGIAKGIHPDLRRSISRSTAWRPTRGLRRSPAPPMRRSWSF